MATVNVTQPITDLLFDYVECIDDDRLEDWPELFVEDCVYKILSRENTERNLDLPIVYCDSRDMLRDRILVFRKALIYSYHYDRHFLSNVRIAEGDGGTYRLRAHYSVFQTDPEGETKIFSTGRYDDAVVLVDGAPKFKEKNVIIDTFAVPNMIATPL